MCANWKATLRETCKMKDDRFILEYIVFQRNEDKRIFGFVEKDGPLTPPPTSTLSMSLLSPHAHCLSFCHTHKQEAHARCELAHDCILAHAHNQQTAFISLYLKKHTCKRAAAHMVLISAPVA